MKIVVILLICCLAIGLLPANLSSKMAWSMVSQESTKPSSTAPAGIENQDRKKEIERLKALHSALVYSLKSGKSLNDKVSTQTLTDLTYKAGYRTGEAQNASHQFYFAQMPQEHSPLTYRDVLKADEDLMVLMNVDRVNVEMDAQPKRCAVEYTEVATGATRSFGLTRTSKKLDPKYYDFVCDCAGTKLRVNLDCTNDQSYTFQCEK
jgi:hypothetical protein